MSMCSVFSCVAGRGCLLWPVRSLGKTLISLCPASFCIPRPNLPVTPGVSWLPTFAFQVYAPTSNAEETEVERFFEDLQDLLELTPKKDALFIKGDWNAKVGSQETPGIIGKFGLGMQNEEEQRQIEICQRKCTGHSKHPLPATQETSPNDQYWNQTDYILCSQRWRSSIQSAKTKLGADWLRPWTPYCQIQA